MMKDGIVVSPHRAASASGATVLRAGGNCVEAALAMAATLCVVYPHMTGLGGDAFWLVSKGSAGSVPHPADSPVFIDACGPAGKNVSLESLHAGGYRRIPVRGAWAGLTMAGAVGGWIKALQVCGEWAQQGHVAQPLPVLFDDAITHAREGFAVSPLLHGMLQSNIRVLSADPWFKETFYPNGVVPAPGQILRLPRLVKTFERLCAEGLESFYAGGLAAAMAADLQTLGSPLVLEDFNYKADVGEALSLKTSLGTFYNCPPPTQGIASLLILGQLLAMCDDGKLDLRQEGASVHAIVEATKNAFLLRSSHVADPLHMAEDVRAWLTPEYIRSMAASIDPEKAAPWPRRSSPGDTVWFGAIDRWGNAASCIQSIYHEFGSGMMLPSTGIIWHNRALGFNLDRAHVNCLGPGKKPFHTLNPALARLHDGRLLSYGTMGGEGQPQTQAAMMFRYLGQGLTPDETLKAPRWLLGRTWGGSSDTLKLEEDFDSRTLSYLQKRDHEMEIIEARSSLMGHAGLLIRHADGRLEGASDPRSDGSVETV